ALVGAKVSIVSNRPQTTRHRLLGIATFPAGQLVLVDTPGLHRDHGKASATAMHRWMNRSARGALEGVDAAMLVVHAGRWEDEDSSAYAILQKSGVPVAVVVNQVHSIQNSATLLAYNAQLTERRAYASVHPHSALKRRGEDGLVEDVLHLVP